MMSRSVMSDTSSVILALAVTVLCAVAAQDEPLKTNKVEFKTQAPPDPFPEAPKDCYEYLFGKLIAIRKHGTTWQNGVADCSNCTCDNGDIRCFFHFCNEPSTGYMTPPTVGGDLSLPAPATEGGGVLPEEEEEDTTEEESSSGFPPDDLTYEDAEEETRAEWPPKILPEKWHKELSAFETSSAPSDASMPQADGGFSILEAEERQDRTENETHDVLGGFCGKTCKKLCPKGFKIDPLTGCWQCKCDMCPRRHVPCETKCPSGYALDALGCATCHCATPTVSGSNDEDIVFNDEGEDGLLGRAVDDAAAAAAAGADDEKDDGEKAEPGEEEDEEEAEGEGWRAESESESSSSSSSSEEGEEDRQWASPNTHSLEEDRTAAPPQGKVTPLKKEAEVTSFPGMKEGIFGLHGNDEEPCDTATTQLRGCLDGTQKFSVGETWSRGPCVACKCVAPGYSECNITQCHALHSCPQSRRFTPIGACCAVCKEDPSIPGFLEIASRSPVDLSSQHREGSLLQEERRKTEGDDDATIRSIPKGDDSHLLLILIPMAVLFSVGVLFLAHMWRRYHRDKYDINAFRHEEKEKLRPVKTLSDDSSSLGHVC